MKLSVLALAAYTTFSSLSFATEPTLPATPVKELNLSLEHLSLTTTEIKNRDKLLKPIYENYETVNLSSVANALESAYGINVYHHMVDKELNLKDKKNVMENAVRYFAGDTSLFNDAAANVLSNGGAVRLKNENANRYYYDKPVVGNNLSLDLIEGNEKKFSLEKKYPSFSILTTVGDSRRIEDPIFWSKIGTRRAVYSSVKKRLYTSPVMNDFLEAMKDLNIKALDATVTFSNGELVAGAYAVVYPNFSKLAPIPQPAIFISETATYTDMIEMLNIHAPKIYAYNKLFTANLLPTVNEINALLTKYPNIIKEVEQKVGKVQRQNMVNAVQAAFLTVTYGAGALLAAPVAITAMAASAVLSPIFIATIIVVM